ncbi:hypothetical protein TSMEX_003852, partial [Taenia solium]
AIEALSRNSHWSRVKVTNGECYVDDQVLGSPCQIDGESANITVNNVSKQEAVHIWNGFSVFSTAFFVPKCNFQKPEEGEVDLNTSFPLSRFRKGKQHVEVKFAVGGANAQSRVYLMVNGLIKCLWQGITLQELAAPICSDLTRDTKLDLRIFVLKFRKNDAQKYTIFEWDGEETRLAVTVDWDQEGYHGSAGKSIEMLHARSCRARLVAAVCIPQSALLLPFLSLLSMLPTCTAHVFCSCRHSPSVSFSLCFTHIRGFPRRTCN